MSSPILGLMIPWEINDIFFFSEQIIVNNTRLEFVKWYKNSMYLFTHFACNYTKNGKEDSFGLYFPAIKNYRVEAVGLSLSNNIFKINIFVSRAYVKFGAISWKK